MILSAIKYISLPFTILLLLNTDQSFGQAPKSSKGHSTEIRIAASDHVFTKVENNGGFPGGSRALGRYVANHFSFAKMEATLADSVQEFSDSVIVCFILKKDGTLKDITSKGGVYPALASEARRLIGSSGLWNPAETCGIRVNAYKACVFYFNRLADMVSVTIREAETMEVKSFPGEIR